MPPSIHNGIHKKQHRMTDIQHPIVILEDDEAPSYPHYNNTREESTSLTSLPPAFNPEFLGVAAAAKPVPAMAPVQIQTAEDLNAVGIKASSAPVTAETVDPFIAAVFQHGFHDQEVIVIDDRDEDEDYYDDFSPRSCLDERDMLEKRFLVQEPRRKAEASIAAAARAVDDDDDDTRTAATASASTVIGGSNAASSSSASSSSSSSMPSHVSTALLVPAITGQHVPPGTKANPPSEPRFIPLTQHQSHYDRLLPYAQVLAFQTKLHTRAVLERTLRIKQKHGPLVKRVVKKSYKAIRSVSKRSIALAAHHGPIVGRKVKRASIQTLEGIQEYEANHQILAKSKEGIQNVWTRQIRGTRASF
ncbi:unnamed protein product [Cylindrotheca closterium]|uniref:Uncharacterized protein n=1 Tax=Cylindrotheca closterium TaxID=2856 RepID=A0AAD2CQX8_9STRA|nr:unnamed protein product [Cylindrotheca closterium]